ncbi:MAG: hypothetical protein Q8Q09_23815 [Deltaproteobacteria bacterium]|nr:hypothetical protein [Deltaproteobacteria bacterium]
MSQVVIAHHGHCFDGACSAAIFSRFLREKRDVKDVTYRGLGYDPNAPPTADKFVEGAVNAVLDFRYTSSPLLTWYFDHHVSAFQEPGAKEHFEGDRSGQKFHDGTYGSCAKLIADVFREQFSWEAPDLAELIRWADIVDAARFASAEVANSLEEPALAITAVVQECGDDLLCAELIPRLMSEKLEDIARSPMIAGKLAPIRERQRLLTDRMARVGEQKGVVAHFDLSDQPVDVVAKFVGYQLFPTSSYSVVLSWTPRRAKLSVGFNPWSPRPRKHNIAALCEKHGGGGHPVVGAIALPGTELPRAKEIFHELIDALNA